MTDDPDLPAGGRSDDVTVVETPERPVEATEPQAVAASDAEPEEEAVVAATVTTGSGGDDATLPAAPAHSGDSDVAVAPSRGRRVHQLLGTLLIAAGLLTIALTVGITAWNRQQHDAETQAFLARVTTPTALSTPSASNNNPTPFPSTVSGALVPDTARTPTANVATRAAQPVATTADGLDRSILAAPPVVSRPNTAAPGGQAFRQRMSGRADTLMA